MYSDYKYTFCIWDFYKLSAYIFFILQGQRQKVATPELKILWHSDAYVLLLSSAIWEA